MRVLVVDDSKTARSVIRKILNAIGYEDVLEAANGEEALEVVCQETVDFVLCDWNMPVVDGLDFVRALQDSPYAELPVVMVSSESYASRIIEVIRAGAQGYIRKPFKPATLRDKIEEVKMKLALRRKSDEGSTLAGSLAEVGFPELVQFIASGSLSGQLELANDDESGTLDFRDGEVRAAQLGDRTGDEAFFAMASFKEGRFRFQREDDPIEARLSMPTLPLLLEAMRQRDERMAKA